MAQSELPNLPPIQPSPSTSPHPSAPMQAQKSAPVSGGKRLRQMVAIWAGGGVALVAVISIAQLVVRPEYSPATMLATIEAQTELAFFNQKLGEERGVVKFTEADYRKQLAEAERAGQAKAELDFQRKLAVVQADKERVVGAYATLYQRANMIAQAAIQLETIAQQFRQQLLAMSNGGRSMVIGVKDLFCGLGSPEACASAHDDRATMISESDELSRGDVGNRVRELMSGIDDPATFISHEDRRRNGVPALPRN